MGTVNPLGKTLDEYWDGLIEGRSTARMVEGSYSTEKLNTKFACEVHGFDPSLYMDRKAAQRMARFSQMAVAASSMALADSGLDLAKEDSFRVGVDMGTGIGGFIEMTAGAISTHTLGHAARIIPHGDAAAMLAGGAEASLCEVGISAFNAIRALSTRNDAPEKASRPFDRNRDGFVPGEGAGTLVLESIDHAINRGARIYG